MGVRVLVGSKKGAFLLESDAARRDWRVRGPFCEHWPLTHVAADPATGPSTPPAATPGSDRRFGDRATTARPGPIRATGSLTRKARRRFNARGASHAAHGRLYVGVEPAGLFVSDDGGESFREIEGLRRAPDAPAMAAGRAGLILHSIVADPADARRLWVGISSVGVFYTEDGGETWSPRNSGTRCDYLPEGERYPEFGQCVHNLTLAPGTPTGSISRTIAACIAATTAAHPGAASRPACRRASAFPSPRIRAIPKPCSSCRSTAPTRAAIPPTRARRSGARATAARTGATCREGLPQSGAYFGVMRQAMATDALDPAGVYFGTSNGSVYASRDEGETWVCLARDLPAISSIETLTTA